MPVRTKTTGRVLDVAGQVGGASPGVVTLDDKSRWGNDGAMTNVTWTQLPSGLWALTFGNVTDEVTIATPPSILFTSQDFSGELWFYATALNAVDYFCIRGWFMTDGWAWYTDATGLFAFQTNQGGSVQTTTGAPPGGDIVVGVWNHLAFTRAGATALLYRNGVDITQVSGVHNDPADASARNFYIGRAGVSCTGYLALMRIYSYALSPAQIRARYGATRGLFGV